MRASPSTSASNPRNARRSRRHIRRTSDLDLKELRVISVGVIITRLTELQNLFDDLGKGKAYGNSTTHWNKLLPKVHGGGAGCCPLLLVGMGVNCYDSNS
jgi:hypothetical protein